MELWSARFDFRRPWRLCSLPRRIGGSPIFFFSRKDAEPQRNSCQFFAPSLLCELFFFFFLLAKTYRPACCRQAQRNYGLLGMTSEGLCGFARPFIFSSRKGAEPAYRQTYLSAAADRPQRKTRFLKTFCIGKM